MTLFKSASHSGSAPSIGELERDIEHRFAALRRLLETTDRINPGVLLDEAFRQIDLSCRELIPYARVEFALLSDDGQSLERRWVRRPETPADSDKQPNREADKEAHQVGTDCAETPVSSLLRDLLTTSEVRIVDDLPALLSQPDPSAFLRLAADEGMQASLLSPLNAAGQAVGLVFFASPDRAAYGPLHVELLKRIGPALSAVIAKGRLYEMVLQAQLDSERLLRNVLPEPIVKRLKAGEKIIADGIPEATVVFVDIVNFVNLSASMSPASIVIVLNRIFSAFDALCEQYGVEKIKTIGDAYMLATGVPKPFPEHVQVAAKIALDIQALGSRLGIREQRVLSFRIGIHTGPVVAGVIGTRKFSYDLWGDTVNIASRMEAHGLPGRIQVTRAVYERLKDDFEFEARGLTNLKGIGDMESFFLLGPKPGKPITNKIRPPFDTATGNDPSRGRRVKDD